MEEPNLLNSFINVLDSFVSNMVEYNPSYYMSACKMFIDVQKKINPDYLHRTFMEYLSEHEDLIKEKKYEQLHSLVELHKQENPGMVGNMIDHMVATWFSTDEETKDTIHKYITTLIKIGKKI